MTADALIEAVATALWQQESLRALGRNRLVAGDEWDDGDRNVWRGLARAALAAIEAAGFRVVPVDPTPTMYGAALEDLVPPADAHAAWRSMLSAAPKLTEGT